MCAVTYDISLIHETDISQKFLIRPLVGQFASLCNDLDFILAREETFQLDTLKKTENRCFLDRNPDAKLRTVLVGTESVTVAIISCQLERELAVLPCTASNDLIATIRLDYLVDCT